MKKGILVSVVLLAALLLPMWLLQPSPEEQKLRGVFDRAVGPGADMGE